MRRIPSNARSRSTGGRESLIGNIVAFAFETDFAGDFDYAPVFQKQARDATLYNRASSRDQFMAA
jgi:hypothetical protein